MIIFLIISFISLTEPHTDIKRGPIHIIHTLICGPVSFNTLVLKGYYFKRGPMLSCVNLIVQITLSIYC